MLDLTFVGERINLLSNLRNWTDKNRTQLLPDIFDQCCRRLKQSAPMLPESIQERVVIEFAKDSRGNIIRIQPLINATPKSIVPGWQQHGGSLQARRETFAIPVCEDRQAEPSDFKLSEQMAEYPER